MLIFDEHNIPVILDSLTSPTVTEHFWVLDLKMLDYTLTPLEMVEETTVESLDVMIGGFVFTLPTSWYVLVVDRETSQLDTIRVSDISMTEFTALTYGFDSNRIKPDTIQAVNYHPNFKNVGPSLNKHQMLCHPISPTMWINISSTDPYNKFLSKDAVSGDII